MITKAEIENRIKSLKTGEVAHFPGSEFGKPGFGIFVSREQYFQSAPYRVSQCGDDCGEHNVFEAIKFVCKEANL